MDDAEQFLPLYLRFIKGVLDSSDLPLNVSRELLQKDPEVEAMRSALTRRALDMLAKLAKDEPEKYAGFWKEFGTVLKEGVAEDYANRDKLLPLLRFASTHETPTRTRRGAGRLRRRACSPARSKIYYVLAESRAAARSSPFIEQLRRARASRCCCWATASTTGSWASCTSSKASLPGRGARRPGPGSSPDAAGEGG